MTTTKKLVKSLTMALLGGGFLFALSTSASANLITQDFDFDMVYTDWIHNINIAQINLLGTLNGVTITETVDWKTALSGVNQDAHSPVTVTTEQAELAVYDSITGPNTSLFDQKIGYSSRHGITLQPSGSVDFGNFVSTNSYVYNYVGAGNTAQFLGTGVVPLTVSTWTRNDQSTSGGGTFVHTQSTEANLEVQVQYNYTGTLNAAAVPEPSAGILLGLGGLFCWSWRRKTAREA